MGLWAWTKVIAQNRRTILKLCTDVIAEYRATKHNRSAQSAIGVSDESVMQLSKPD
jgi:hypothetical protein